MQLFLISLFFYFIQSIKLDIEIPNGNVSSFYDENIETIIKKTESLEKNTTIRIYFNDAETNLKNIDLKFDNINVYFEKYYYIF